MDPLCPVMLITGAPNVETAAQAFHLGVYDYIPKPIKQDTLLRICRMALSVHRLREEREKVWRNLETWNRFLKSVAGSSTFARAPESPCSPERRSRCREPFAACRYRPQPVPGAALALS